MIKVTKFLTVKMFFGVILFFSANCYSLGDGKFDAQPEWFSSGNINWNGDELSWNIFRHPLYGSPETENEIILYCDMNSNKMILAIVDENNTLQMVNSIYGKEKGSNGFTIMFDNIKGKTFDQFYSFFDSLQKDTDIGLSTVDNVMYSNLMHQNGVGDLKEYKNLCAGKTFVDHQ